MPPQRTEKGTHKSLQKCFPKVSYLWEKRSSKKFAMTRVFDIDNWCNYIGKRKNHGISTNYNCMEVYYFVSFMGLKEACFHILLEFLYTVKIITDNVSHSSVR